MFIAYKVSGSWLYKIYKCLSLNRFYVQIVFKEVCKIPIFIEKMHFGTETSGLNIEGGLNFK